MHAIRARFLPCLKGVRTFAASGNPDNKDISNLFERLASHENKKTKSPKKKNAIKFTIPIEKEAKTNKDQLPIKDNTVEEKLAKDVSAKDQPAKKVIAKDDPIVKDNPVTDPDLLKLSNLLQALEKDANVPGKPNPLISDIFSGIKVNVDRMKRSRLQSMFTQKHESSSLDFLMGSGLGIFDEKAIAECRKEAPESMFDRLERESVEDSIKTIPRNFFEEAIALTEEGKLWNFPINNEQDLEADESFHEHIFLDRYLSLFPNKGPIRHFMELVLNGLSKNAFLTVQEKEDHIMWFVEYFKDKRTEAQA